jgi:hypothetical protein
LPFKDMATLCRLERCWPNSSYGSGHFSLLSIYTIIFS